MVVNSMGPNAGPPDAVAKRVDRHDARPSRDWQGTPHGCVKETVARAQAPASHLTPGGKRLRRARVSARSRMAFHHLLEAVGPRRRQHTAGACHGWLLSIGASSDVALRVLHRTTEIERLTTAGDDVHVVKEP